MAISSATVTMNLADLLGVDFDIRRTKVWVSTNIPGNAVIDTVGNQIRLGTGNVTLNADGTASLSTWIPGTGANPASWQTYVNVDYRDSGSRERVTRTFGPFTITGNADLADLVAEQEIPPTYLAQVSGTLAGYVADAKAARDTAQALVLSDLGTTDGQTRALVQNPASQTAVALSASYVGKASTKAAGTAHTVTREVGDPNRTASKWREVFDTGTFLTDSDPVMFIGWNADRAAGAGDAGEASIYMGMEAHYRVDIAGLTNTVEWYVGVIPDGGVTGGAHRPFALTAGRDNTDRWAQVQMDIGTDTRGVFNLVAGPATSIMSATKDAFSLARSVTFNRYIQLVNDGGSPAAMVLTAGGTTRWAHYLYNGDPNEYLWDVVNNRAHVTHVAGASSAAARTEFASQIVATGSITADAASVVLTSKAASNAHLSFRHDSTEKWYLANFRGDENHYLWDPINGRFQMKYTRGTTSDLAVTEFNAIPRLNATADTAATAGAATALPATPAGYFRIKDSAGTTRKVPYYA